MPCLRMWVLSTRSPMIEHTKDDKYKVRNCNGKAILHNSFADAEKLAIETYKKFEKFNKSFEG